MGFVALCALFTIGDMIIAMNSVNDHAQSRLRYEQQAKAQLKQYRDMDTPIYLCFKRVLEAIDIQGPMVPGAVQVHFEHCKQMVHYVRFTAPGSGYDEYMVVWEESWARDKDRYGSRAVIHFIGRCESISPQGRPFPSYG